ncbi:hypothetical protein C7271_16185 [filamentous cyanobacterium CCP5]|nr:hypothetical protein C7271_16185 [filamentous cyanobacterium CCP5]
MSNEFRELLKHVGSGSHTSRALTRAEAAAATRMMLTQTATPAQIGAFMIAHRIKRPTAEELAGTLDAYEARGPTLPAIAPDSAYSRRALVLSCPYDGRSRTAPVTPVTALVLMAAGVPVVASDRGLEGLAVDQPLAALRANRLDDYLDGISKLFDQPQLRQAIARQARQLVESHFTWEQIGSQYEQILLG